MQKVINLISVISFVGVAGIYAGGTYLYMQKDSIVENVKGQITSAITETVTDALPGLLDSAVPELPETTGPAIPF